jgi:hypothetical protein
MTFYRSRLDTGELEYARIEDGRAAYFDDELRIWITDDLLALEIAEDGTWVECSADEVLDPATLVLSD